MKIKHISKHRPDTWPYLYYTNIQIFQSTTQIYDHIYIYDTNILPPFPFHFSKIQVGTGSCGHPGTSDGVWITIVGRWTSGTPQLPKNQSKWFQLYKSHRIHWQKTSYLQEITSWTVGCGKKYLKPHPRNIKNRFLAPGGFLDLVLGKKNIPTSPAWSHSPMNIYSNCTIFFDRVLVGFILMTNHSGKLTNMEPKHHPIQKEKHLPNLHFWASKCSFSMGVPFLKLM